MQTLPRTLGGEYWKEILLEDNGLQPEEREKLVIEGYKQKLSSTGYLIYTGSCPVQDKRKGARKYYMIFASRHQDALILFNDNMCRAYNEYMNNQEIPLFSSLDWTSLRDTESLVNLVVEYIHRFPNKTRKELSVLMIKDHFMEYLEKEYRHAVTEAEALGLISSPTQRKTKRLNDNCVLIPVSSSPLN